MRMRTILVTAILTTCCLAAAPAAEVEPKVVRLALFKNGLGFFHSSVALPDEATRIELGQLPVPSLGTFWVSYPDDLELRGIFTRMVESEEAVAATHLPELLRANVGREGVFRVGEQVIEGRLSAVTAPDRPEQPGPYVMSMRPGNVHGSGLAMIETGEEVIMLDVNRIHQAAFSAMEVQMPPGLHAVRKTTKPVMRIELTEPAKGESVTLSYLARGVTWSPSYLIDLSDPETARFSAKALIVNETADLENVEVELVSGFPHLQFSDIESPIAMRQSLAEFFQELNSGRDRTARWRDVMTQQRLMVNVAPVHGQWLAAPAAYSTAQQGSTVEDLFFYPIEALTLMRGETALIPLFTAEAEYEHIYKWNVADLLDENERYRSRESQSRDDRREAGEIWHVCRIENGMKMPWTTAPTEFVQNGRIIGQDICYYTPAGRKADIRINRAIGVVADDSEIEIERKRNAERFYHNSYDLVTVRGELKLHNSLGKAVHMEVTKELSGEVKDRSHEAKDVRTAEGLRRVNPRHRLIWDFELEAGEEVTLTYVYDVYVRN